MSGAKKVKDGDLPQLRNVVEEMALAAGLPQVPDIYVIDDEAPNAFATGRRPETAAVAVTSGLLKTLNRDELQGVIGHEIGHVRNRDIQLMLFAGVLAGAIVILAEVGLRGMWFGGGRSRSRRRRGRRGPGHHRHVAIVLMILAPIIAQLIYFAVSRKREYLADASSASFTRYPEGLASALEKIAASPRQAGLGHQRDRAHVHHQPPEARREGGGQRHQHPPAHRRARAHPARHGPQLVRRLRRGLPPGQGRRARRDARVGAEGRPGGRSGAGRVGRRARCCGTIRCSRERARQVDDFLYREQGWRRVECECGTVLKLPPDFAAPRAKCPRCGRVHSL